MFETILNRLLSGLCAVALLGLPGCGPQVQPPESEQTPAPVQPSAPEETPGSGATIPEELEYVPEGYYNPAEHQGTLEKLEYQTWESFSYEEHTQKLTKTAWVYLPYGYTEQQQYNVLYLSHGG